MRRRASALKARPLPPAPQAPAGGASLRPGPVEFSWENGEEAASFRFQLASDERFGTLLIDRAGLTERRLVSGDLEPGRYYWRVGSTRADGDAGPFGEARAFTVQAPAPEQGSPFPGVSVKETQAIGGSRRCPRPGICHGQGT